MSCILGLSGLFGTEEEDYPPDVSSEFFHDAAAAVIVDGEPLAALEEERINRQKHTNRFPIGAVRFCLQQAQRKISDVDTIAYFFEEEYTDRELARCGIHNSAMEIIPSRQLIRQRLSDAFDSDLSSSHISFVPHHLAHAEATYRDSTFGRTLVAVIDGNGESAGISIFDGAPDGMILLRTYSRGHSLGHFYRALTDFLGYRPFDEYKVMGLASYGDPESFYPVLRELYELKSDGNYRLNVDDLPNTLLDAGIKPRRKWEEAQQAYADLAASGQRLVQDVTSHLLAYWQDVTGHDSLCLSGGVAQNTTMNGHILRSGKFRRLYVHPASHDAGASLGAAYAVERQQAGGNRSPLPLTSAYLGPDLGDVDAVRQELEAWCPLIEWTKPTSVVDAVASRLASGQIGGWAQGRSEFGPRALGNRSILADARPAANRDRVNRLIKLRESYRPLAPAVLEERAADFFVIPQTLADYSYMGFVLKVKQSRQDELAAVTHVDGTARVQVVRKKHNPMFWDLIEKFGELTGMPVLLNTSFNNYAEPIVQSTRDAIACLLTTDLSWIVVGPYLVTKPPMSTNALLGLSLSLPPFCLVQHQYDQRGTTSIIRRRGDARLDYQVSNATADLVIRASRSCTSPISSLIADGCRPPVVAEEIAALWERRLVRLDPVPSGQQPPTTQAAPRPPTVV